MSRAFRNRRKALRRKADVATPVEGTRLRRRMLHANPCVDCTGVEDAILALASAVVWPVR